MEEKKFFEVFPTLEISKELSGIFAEGVVYHITMNSARTQIKIYIKFTDIVKQHFPTSNGLFRTKNMIFSQISRKK